MGFLFSPGIVLSVCSSFGIYSQRQREPVALFNCVLAVTWLLVLYVSSSRCFVTGVFPGYYTHLVIVFVNENTMHMLSTPSYVRLSA